MAIFVSKKVLATTPGNFDTDYVPLERRQLQSDFLLNKPFFKNLARQSQGAKPLKKGSEGKNVGNLQVLINVVRKIQTGQDLNLTVDTIFGSNTEAELKAIQQEFGFPESGILDADTLLAMDSLVKNSGAIHSTTNGRVYFSKNTTGNEFYDVDIFSENGNIFLDIEAKQAIRPTPTPENMGGTALNIPAVTTIDSLPGVAVNLEDDLQGFSLVQTDGIENTAISPPAIFVERGLIPVKPSGLPPGTKPRKIQPEETLVSIINEEYLAQAYTIYSTPGDDSTTPVFEFPARSLSIEDRDYRIRFIANLIYYMNQDPGVSYAIRRADTSVLDYDEEDLDQVNIYNNETLGLNYKRFIEEMNGLNTKKYEWDFFPSNYPVNGVNYTFDAPFVLNEGENLYLPSRELVEAMYYHLNFRPKEGEMYQKVTEGENSFFDWITEDAFGDFIDLVTSTLTEAVTETVALYQEARDFFISIYDWLIAVIDDYWIRTMGFKIGAGASAGVLYGGGGNFDAYMWRKLTKKDELVLQSISKLGVFVEAGLALGEQLASGRKSGKSINTGNGKSRSGLLPVELAGIIGATGSIGIDIYIEHEFPIDKNNTALLSIMFAAISATTSVLAGPLKIMDFFDFFNFNTDDYIKKLVLSLNKEIAVQGNVTIGLNVNDDPDYGKNNSGDFTLDQKNHDALSVNNILTMLKKLDFSLGGIANFTQGFELNLEFEYDNLPNIYKYDGRMPNEVKVDFGMVSQKSLDTYSTSSNFIARFLGLPSIFDFLDSFEFDEGIGFEVGFTYTRSTVPENHVFANYTWDNSGLNDPNNNFKTRMAVFQFNGDFETPLVPSGEVKYIINIPALAATFVSATAHLEIPDLDSFLNIFYAVEIRKRFGLDEPSGADVQKVTKLNSLRDKTDKFHNKNYSNGTDAFKKSTSNVKGKIALELASVFKLASARTALTYVLLRLRFTASEDQFASQTERALYKTKKGQIGKAFKDRFDAITDDEMTQSGFFDDLLNNSVTGLYAIMEIDADGNSNLPWVSYISLASELVALLQIKQAFKELSTAINQLDFKELAQEITTVLDAIFTEFVAQTETTLKINSLIGIEKGFGFIVGVGGRISLDLYLEGGFFDEILILDKGEQTLRGVLDDTDFTGYIEDVLGEFRINGLIPDFLAENLKGGPVGQLLTNPTKENAQ